MNYPGEMFRRVGTLQGHRDWVTAIRTPMDATPDAPYHLVSSSRDKKVMVWRYEPDQADETSLKDAAVLSLSGHSQAVQDLALPIHSRYCISASWDKTMRLWDLERGTSIRTFIGHQSDVFSVALSPDSRQIISGSRDKTIKLWNTIAECKYTIEDDRHDGWVSCVRFSPSEMRDTLIVSCGWDWVVKVWDLSSCALKTNLMGHTAAVHTITISPDGSLCASGGKDGVAMLWDVKEGKHLYSLVAGSTIHSLCFSPSHYWLCAALDDSIKIWCLENKHVIAEISKPAAGVKEVVSEAVTKKIRERPTGAPYYTALAWSADGRTLFAGRSSGEIEVHELVASD